MSERPIDLRDWEVRAFRDGRKTMLRRVVKPKWPVRWERGVQQACDYAVQLVDDRNGHWKEFPCPFGQPGDRLWVRETWACCYLRRGPDDEYVSVASDGASRALVEAGDRYLVYRTDGEDAFEGRWRPSTHMPRWASRLSLEVVSVRVERVQEISEADAVAEGINPDDMTCHCGGRAGDHTVGDGHSPVLMDDIASGKHEGYRALWDSDHAKKGDGWDTNPWVWVGEVKVGGGA